MNQAASHLWDWYSPLLVSAIGWGGGFQLPQMHSQLLHFGCGSLRESPPGPGSRSGLCPCRDAATAVAATLMVILMPSVATITTITISVIITIVSTCVRGC